MSMVVEMDWQDISHGSRYWLVDTDRKIGSDIAVGGFIRAMPMYDPGRIYEGARWYFINTAVIWKMTVLSDDVTLMDSGAVE